MRDVDQRTVVGARTMDDRPHVLVADGDVAARRWIREAVAGDLVIDEVDNSAQALDLLAAGVPRILVVGGQLADTTGADFIERAAPALAQRTRVFLLADASGEFASVDEQRVAIFYRLTTAMQAERARALLQQAAAALPAQPPSIPDTVPANVAAHVQRIAACGDAEAAARSAIEAVRELLCADRARCIYCDDETNTLWPEGETTDGSSHPSTGLVGFTIRTGASISVPCAAADPQFVAALDDPTGDGDESLAVQPVLGLDGHVHAVLIAVRSRQQSPFSSLDVAILGTFAAAWAPYLQQLAMQTEADAILGEQLDRAPSDLFRHEAIASLVRRGARGDVVRVHPGWIRAAYWLVVAAVLGAVVFAATASVHQYTNGTAIVRFTGRSDIVAFDPGTVTTLEVQRGQRVVAGQALARMHDAEQLARLRGLDRDFERKLIAYLQSPADTGVRQALAEVVSSRESARAGVDAKVIRAPRAGVVKDTLVRTGQRVDAGTTLMSIVEEDATEAISVLAFVPGSERPRLRPHQQLTLTLPGYRGARVTADVVAVSGEVLGANEARSRYLGDRVGDSLPLRGTVVVVEAKLSRPTFEADGQRYQLHDGMIGTAEIRLGSRTLFEMFIPGLQQ